MKNFWLFRHSIRRSTVFLTLVVVPFISAHSQSISPYYKISETSRAIEQISAGYDINNNNRPEVLVIYRTDDKNNSLALMELGQENAVTLWEFSPPSDAPGNIVDAVFTDMDKNGKPEIMCAVNTAAPSGRQPWLYGFEWDGDTFQSGKSTAWAYQQTEGVILRPTDLTAGDFDGDGKTEIVAIFGSPERLGLVIQREGKFAGGIWTPEFEFALPDDDVGGYRYHLAHADLTGDHVVEFILFSERDVHRAIIYTYVNANQYAPATSIDFSSLTPISSPLLVDFGDLTGDGFNDIVYSAQDGILTLLTRLQPEEEIFQFTPVTIRQNLPVLNSLVTSKESSWDRTRIYLASATSHQITQLVLGEDTSDTGEDGFRASTLSTGLPEGSTISALAMSETRESPALYAAVSPADGGTAILRIPLELTSEQPKSEMTSATTKPPGITSARQSTSDAPDHIAYISKSFVYPVDFNILSLQNLKIVFTSAPEGMTYNHRSSKLEWTPKPAQKGFHKVEINVESTSYKHTEKFTVLAKVDPPSITSDPTTVVTAREPWEYQITVADATKYDSLSYSLISAPDGMTINSTGWLYWEPTLNQVDDHSITIGVSDGYDIDTQSFSVYVNAPPSFLSQPDTLVNHGEEYTYHVLIGDRNKDAKLKLGLSQHPEGMRLEGRKVVWKPQKKQVDYFPMSLELSDGFLTTSQSWRVFVNAPPKITSTPLNALPFGQEFRYQIEVQDPNSAQTHAFTLLQGPAGMKIDPTGLLAWMPEKATINRQTFKIEVTDGYLRNQQDGEVFINVPPDIISQPERVAVSELKYSYELQVQDDNGDQVSFQAIKLPRYADFDADLGVINWKPAIDQVGPQEFKLQATDSHGATVTQEFSVQVYENPSTKPLIFSGYYILIALLGGIFVATAAL